MAYASLKSKIYASASANAGLRALLVSTATVFQWGDQLLPQKWDLTHTPAVTAMVISNPKDYIGSGAMFTSYARVQLSIYAPGPNSESADAVAQAIFAWLKTLCLTGVPNQASNYVVGDRDGGIAATEPLTYQRFLDVMIFNSDDN